MTTMSSYHQSYFDQHPMRMARMVFWKPVTMETNCLQFKNSVSLFVWKLFSYFGQKNKKLEMYTAVS